MSSSAPTYRSACMVLLLWAIVLPSAGAIEQHFDSLQAVHAALDLGGVLSDAAHLKRSYLGAKSKVAGVATLQAYVDGAKSWPHKEFTLFHLAGALADDKDDRAESALVWLAAYRPRVVVPHPEGRGAEVTAAFPIPTRAFGALNERAYADQYDLVRSSLREGRSYDWAAGFATLSPPRRRATLAAVAGSHESWVKKSLLTLDTKSMAPELLAFLAARTKDKSLYLAALSRSEEWSGATLLRQAVTTFTEPEALQILTESVQGPTGPAAVAMLGELAQTSTAARDQLVVLLDDERFGSAAALALGPLADKAILRQVERRLMAPRDGAQVTPWLLLLRNNRSPLAGRILEQYLAGSAAENSKSAQVKQWIR